jgi:hypothetical protein
VCPVLEVRVAGKLEYPLLDPHGRTDTSVSCSAVNFFQRLLARSTLCRTVQTGSRVAVRLQYKAPDELPDLHRSLTFYLQTCTFLSGADGIRTHALRRAKADRYILARTSMSGDFNDLQVSCRITDSALSAAYQLVLAWLQYAQVLLTLREVLEEKLLAVGQELAVN